MTASAANSKFIQATAFLLWSFPITYILAMVALYNLTFSSALDVFFSTIYLLHSVLAVYVGFLVYQLRPWVWHFFVFHCVLIVLEQFYIGYQYAEVHFLPVSILLAICSVLIFAWLVKLELRVPYFSPRIAWWENDPRYKIVIPINLEDQNEGTTKHEGVIMDISHTGCFVKTSSQWKLEQKLLLTFSLFEEEFHFKGKVVWITNATVTHPRGIGVKFKIEDKNVALTFKKEVKKVRKLNKAYSQMRNERKASEIEKKVESYSMHKKN